MQSFTNTYSSDEIDETIMDEQWLEYFEQIKADTVQGEDFTITN